MAVTDESEHSQSDTITYDDPAGRMEREKIMAQLKRGCSPSPDITTEEDEEINTANKVGIPREAWPSEICKFLARLTRGTRVDRSALQTLVDHVNYISLCRNS